MSALFVVITLDGKNGSIESMASLYYKRPYYFRLGSLGPVNVLEYEERNL